MLALLRWVMLAAIAIMRQSPLRTFNTGNRYGEPQLPGPDPDPASLLGRSGLRHPAALRHGNGGRDLPPGDRPQGAGAGSVEGSLCPAVPSPDRWPLRRESQSAGSLLPISGDAEAEPG